MITRTPTMTALLKWPNYNPLAKCSHSVHIKPGWLSRNVCKTKKNLNLLEKLKLIKDSKAKCLRNLASQFGISVGEHCE